MYVPADWFPVVGLVASVLIAALVYHFINGRDPQLLFASILLPGDIFCETHCVLTRAT